MACRKVIELSGTPASGKNVITTMLTESDPSIVLFEKHRGLCNITASKPGYVNVKAAEFEAMIATGEFLQYHGRYGRSYGVSQRKLIGMLDKGLTPVIHIGRIENHEALAEALDAIYVEHTHILIWNYLDEIERRLDIREPNLMQKQIRIDAALEEMRDHLRSFRANQNPFNLIIFNDDAIKTRDEILAFIDDSASFNKQIASNQGEYEGYLETLLGNEVEFKRDSRISGVELT